MWHTIITRRLVPLIITFIALGLGLTVSTQRASATPSLLCGVNQVSVPESTTGVTTSVYLTSGQSLAITGSGSIWAGYWLTGTNGPEGWNKTAANDYPLPGARSFSLLARADYGPWTYIGSSGTVTNHGPTTVRLQLRTNDNVPGNGSGAFTATFTTCDLSTSPVSQYTVVPVSVQHSGLCLTVDNPIQADGAPIAQGSCGQQRWTLRPTYDGYYELVSASSGKCVDVANYGTQNANPVQLWGCLHGANQQWSLQQVSPGWYELVGRQSGRCLDVAGISPYPSAPIFIWDCWNGPNQRWHFG